MQAGFEADQSIDDVYEGLPRRFVWAPVIAMVLGGIAASLLIAVRSFGL